MRHTEKTDLVSETDFLPEEDEESETAPIEIENEAPLEVVEEAPPSADVRKHLNETLLQKARKLKAQRQVLRKRMEKIEESKNEVKASVYQRVLEDYKGRWEETRRSFLALKQEIDKELDALRNQEKEAAKLVESHHEKIEEVRFRHQIGECSDADYESASLKIEAVLEKSERALNALQGALEQYEGLFTDEDLSPPSALKKAAKEKTGPTTPPPPPPVGKSEPRAARRQGVEAETDLHDVRPKEAVLRVLQNGQVAGEYPIGKELTIGRSPSNTISIKEAKVSRRHASILMSAKQYVIIDNDSSNGTFVNEKRISEHILKPGDRIQIGSMEMEFVA